MFILHSLCCPGRALDTMRAWALAASSSFPVLLRLILLTAAPEDWETPVSGPPSLAAVKDLRLQNHTWVPSSLAMRQQPGQVALCTLRVACKRLIVGAIRQHMLLGVCSCASEQRERPPGGGQGPARLLFSLFPKRPGPSQGSRFGYAGSKPKRGESGRPGNISIMIL